VEAALDAVDGEAIEAKAIVVVTQAELAGELNSIFPFLFGLHLDEGNSKF
jgi:hypothetical protein